MTFTLEQITEILGRHYQASLEAGGANPERVLRLFTDRVVDDLRRVGWDDKDPSTWGPFSSQSPTFTADD